MSEKKNLYQKICEVMQHVESVEKGVTVQMYGGNSYAAVGHDDVTRLLHMPLAKIGIVVVADMTDHVLTEGVTSKGTKIYISNVWARVKLINADNPEESIETNSFALGLDSQDKGPGKAYSMAVKYCYLKLFMLESKDNEEERVQDSVNTNVNNKNQASSTNKKPFSNPKEPYKWQWEKLKELCIANSINMDNLRPKVINFTGDQLYKLTGDIMKLKGLPDELC